jgi:hypothetical protein
MKTRTVVFIASDEGGGADRTRLARREMGSGLARAFDQSARRLGVRTEEGELVFPLVAKTGKRNLAGTED